MSHLSHKCQHYFSLFCILPLVTTTICGIRVFVEMNFHVFSFCTIRIVFRWRCDDKRFPPSQIWYFDPNINGLCHNVAVSPPHAHKHALPRVWAVELKSHFRNRMELQHPCSTCVSTCGCFRVCVAVVLKAGCANGSLNDCAQGGVDLFAKAAAFMNVHAFVSMVVGVKEGERDTWRGCALICICAWRNSKCSKWGCNLF